MNPAAILSLISDLITQISALREENAALKAHAASAEPPPAN